MAPTELAWQAAARRYGCRSTAPWPASGAGGLELRRNATRAPKEKVCAFLCERTGAEPTTGVSFSFASDGRCGVDEFPPGGGERHHDLSDGCASVRLLWEKVGGRWKLWVEADGEKLVLQATFEIPEPQLELFTHSDWVNCFDLSLLHPPGPGGTLQSPTPAHAELQAQVNRLTTELQTEKLQKAEIQQRLDESTRQCRVLAQEKAEETRQKVAIMREKQELQNQLDESKRRYDLLAREKAEETQKAESAQHEKEALQQRIDSLMAELGTEKQQKEITQTLQKRLDEFAQEKAEEMKKVEGLRQENQIMQQRIALLTQKAQKSEQMTQRILQLKEHCDDVLAPLRK